MASLAWAYCLGLLSMWCKSQEQKLPEAEKDTDQRWAESRPVMAATDTHTQQHPPGIRHRCQDQAGLLSQHTWRFSVPSQGPHLVQPTRYSITGLGGGCLPCVRKPEWKPRTHAGRL